jgi:hypothetical protein
MATGNSSAATTPAVRCSKRTWARAGWAGGLAAAALLATAEPAIEPAVLARRAEQAYEEARERFQAHTNEVAAAWKLGRAALAWADFAEDNTQRERVARSGIAACRQALALDPDCAAAHFYLATNLGQLARARKLEALSIVREMERQFQAAQAGDERFHYAGPDRCLGLLYLDAPGWPASIGSRRRARERLERAVALCPDFPENRLSLMEAYARWKDVKQLRAQATAYEQGLDEARRQFAGETWAGDWQDWNPRWKSILDQLKRLQK